ncbi:MAG TPA: M56 family metallopeptidase [Terriglobales bacterium]|nr:M56 family metallopeptidase [Terriglobales bacterium]
MPATLLPALLEAALRGAVVFAIVALAMPLLRRRSAAVRHAAWSFAVGAQLVFPALALIAPSWGAPLVEPPAWVADVLTPRPAGTGAETRSAAGAAPAAATPPGAVSTAARGRGGRDGAAAPAGSRGEDGTDGLPGTLAALWSAGAGLILLHLAVGTLGVWRLAARSRRVLDAGWLALAHELAARVGISRPLTLLRGEALALPVTWGVVYPVVLLPADADAWDDEQRRYVLVHELAHIRRFDALTHLVAQVTLALFWFNPLVWLAVSRMRVEREHACDDYVLRAGTRPSRYANDLLTMVRSIGLPNRRSAAPAFATLAMARRSEFEGRMIAILGDDTPRDPLSRRGIAGGTAAAAALALALAGFSPLAAREGATPTEAARDAPIPLVAKETADVRSPVTTDARREATAEVRSPVTADARRETTAEVRSPVTPGAQEGSGRIDTVAASQRADGNMAAILAQYARSGDDNLLWAAIRAVPTLPHDGQKSVVLSHAAPGALGRGDARLRDAFFAALGSIASDEDRTVVLVHAMVNGQASPAVTARVLRAAARMRSPEAASTVLMNVAQRHLVTSDSLRVLYVRTADALASDPHSQLALTALRRATRRQPPTHP